MCSRKTFKYSQFLRIDTVYKRASQKLRGTLCHTIDIGGCRRGTEWAPAYGGLGCLISLMGLCIVYEVVN
jgi:hypothetical protein